MNSDHIFILDAYFVQYTRSKFHLIGKEERKSCVLFFFKGELDQKKKLRYLRYTINRNMRYV